MRKLVDINPFRGNLNQNHSGGNLLKPESSFKRMKNFLKARYKQWLIWLAAIIGLAVLLKLLALVWLSFFGFPKIDKSKLQAVFISNGLVYFGHLQAARGDYLTLKNVYYLRLDSQQQAGNINLVKLGNEVYRPDDMMYIPQNQILFWQNMDIDSPVAKLINESEGK